MNHVRIMNTNVSVPLHINHNNDIFVSSPRETIYVEYKELLCGQIDAKDVNDHLG